MNWWHSENGPTHPIPEPGVTTFIGHSLTHLAGKGRKWSEKNVYCRWAAIDLLRKQGLSCTLPPEDYTFDHDVSALSTKEKEIEYLENCYSVIEMEKDGETGTALVDATIAQSPHYALGRVEHTKETIESEELEVVKTTNPRPRGSSSFLCSPVTLFELKFGNKVIAKAICSYKNSEMDNPGPTIELLEVAAEWQKHGHAITLLGAMTTHFQEAFADLEDSGEAVKYNDCHVTNHQACRWFLSQGFRDWDGMGEELGMMLFDE